MKAKIRREGEIFIIHLKGKIDFDSTEPFRETVLSHLIGQKVVFNLSELSFVGSNGITPFMETMTELCNGAPTRIHFCHLSSEFRRIFEASEITSPKIFETEEIATTSFYRVFQDSSRMPEISEPAEGPPAVEVSINLDSPESTPD